MESQDNSNTKKYRNCLHLYKLLSPKNSGTNFNVISELVYEEDETLLIFTQKAEVPTTICTDDPKGSFLCCEFNRDGDCYRSPISNLYFPTPDDVNDMKIIPEELRNLEIKLNKVFQNYIKAYYSAEAICSVYLDTTDDNMENGFLVNVRIKNPIKDKTKDLDTGCWDSNNIIEVKYIPDNQNVRVEYKISSSVYLTLNVNNGDTGNLNASGYTIKTKVVNCNEKNINDTLHIEKIGELVEDQETLLTNSVENVYIKKSREIIESTRSHPIEGRPNAEAAMNLKNVFFHRK